jgi:hypothetical protein
VNVSVTVTITLTVTFPSNILIPINKTATKFETSHHISMTVALFSLQLKLGETILKLPPTFAQPILLKHTLNPVVGSAFDAKSGTPLYALVDTPFW